MARSSAVLLIATVAIGVGVVAYTAGVAAGRAEPVARAIHAAAQPAQAQNPVIPPEPFLGPQQGPAPQPAPGPQPFQFVPPGQSPPTMREFIPLPGPGDQQPG